jgi:hypothetical protein
MVNKKIKDNPMYSFLLLLTIASAMGLQGWRTLFNNFAVETVGSNGFWIGLIQSIREVPGFLALLVIYILFIVKEHRLSSISVLILGVGVSFTGVFASNIGLVVTTLVMSVGFHYFETTNQSLTLQYFNNTESPTVLARLRSLSSLANVGVGAFIWILSMYLKLEILFFLIGIIVAGIGVFTFFKDPSDKSLPTQHKKMILRKKYWLFYMLNLLAGARRQIFIVFAVFLLVDYYKFSVQAITILFVVNNAINYFFTPLIGKAINRFGERKVLSLEYGSLIFIFLAYAFIQDPWVAGILYIMDHLFFNFAIGIKTYFQKHADKPDIAPSMAVSFTINHITAVFLPFIGGILWMVDRRIPFIAGAFLSVLSLIFTQFMKKKQLSSA